MTQELPSTKSTRGAETRAALIAAGIELFGSLGYHAASSRALARSAKVNQALIGYHFGGKRGLYVAVFAHVADRLAERLAPARDAITTLLDRDGSDRRRLETALVAVLDRLVETFIAEETAAWASLIVREQQQPSEAFDVLFERAMFPMLELVSQLLGALESKPPDSTEIRMLVVTIFGQTLIFRVARASVLRTLGVEELGPADVEAIKHRVRANVLAMLSPENGS